MNHPSELISAYLDGEAHGRDLDRLTDHLARCGRCSAELDEMQQIRSAVRSLPILDMPDGIVPDGDPGVVPLRQRRGVWAGAAAALAALVIALASIAAPAPETVTIDELNSRFGARASLDPAFGPAKIVVPPGGGQ